VQMIEVEKPSDTHTERFNIDSPLMDLNSFSSSDFCRNAPGEILFGLNGVTKIFDDGMVGLEKVSFCMKKGEFVSLVGPNQSGKTTLLRLIAGEEKPTQGEIIFDGLSSRYLRKSQMPFWRRKLGLILDDLELIPDLSIFDNVALSLRMLGKAEKKVGQQVRGVLNMVGLSTKSRSWPRHISSAERQKVAVARAIVRNPLLLLADEPTNNLDEESAQEIIEVLLKVNLFGTAVLMTSTESFRNNGFPGRVIRVEKGRAIQTGSLHPVSFPTQVTAESPHNDSERVMA
jgi:cell division transport system ATP-binding protein